MSYGYTGLPLDLRWIRTLCKSDHTVRVILRTCVPHDLAGYSGTGLHLDNPSITGPDSGPFDLLPRMEGECEAGRPHRCCQRWTIRSTAIPPFAANMTLQWTVQGEGVLPNVTVHSDMHLDMGEWDCEPEILDPILGTVLNGTLVLYRDVEMEPANMYVMDEGGPLLDCTEVCARLHVVGMPPHAALHVVEVLIEYWDPVSENSQLRLLYDHVDPSAVDPYFATTIDPLLDGSVAICWAVHPLGAPGAPQTVYVYWELSTGGSGGNAFVAPGYSADSTIPRGYPRAPVRAYVTEREIAMETHHVVEGSRQAAHFTALQSTSVGHIYSTLATIEEHALVHMTKLAVECQPGTAWSAAAARCVEAGEHWEELEAWHVPAEHDEVLLALWIVLGIFFILILLGSTCWYFLPSWRYEEERVREWDRRAAAAPSPSVNVPLMPQQLGHRPMPDIAGLLHRKRH